jgi:hypothetical protein
VAVVDPQEQAVILEDPEQQELLLSQLTFK